MALKKDSIYFLLVGLVLVCVACPSQWRPAPQKKTPDLVESPSKSRLKEISSLSLPDFDQIKDTFQKKEAFFNFILPLSATANQQIIVLREKILAISAGGVVEQNKPWLQKIGRKYGLEDLAFNNDEDIEALLMRVDEIPHALVLAQSANESAWGTSRFAKMANNLFGQWCFKKGCGIVPQSRTKGSRHEVRKFPSVFYSVKSYMHNLNSHPMYEQFRQKRASLRRKNRPLDPYRMAQTLTNYSERGDAYVKEIQAMIRYNKLDQLVF